MKKYTRRASIGIIQISLFSFLAIFLTTYAKPAEASCIYNHTRNWAIKVILGGFTSTWHQVKKGERYCFTNEDGKWEARGIGTGSLSKGYCSQKVYAHDWVKVKYEIPPENNGDKFICTYKDTGKHKSDGHFK